jgi:hypothetical protein
MALRLQRLYVSEELLLRRNNIATIAIDDFIRMPVERVFDGPF